MDLLTLILACSFVGDDNLVRALAGKLSLGNPFMVGDLSTLDTYDGARSADDARQIVDRISARDGRPAVGYMAVPVEWAPRFGRTAAELFDGCTNIAVATAMLSEYERACSLRRGLRHATGRSRSRVSPPLAMALRRCILRRLEIDLDITGVVDHVFPEIAKLDRSRADPDPDSMPDKSPVDADTGGGLRVQDVAVVTVGPRLVGSPNAAPLSARSSASPKAARLPGLPARQPVVGPPSSAKSPSALPRVVTPAVQRPR